ncbi:StbB family protein [Burkholderia gladioli]|uniref:StbB family protein n=1 Tax=Burkholderia gladioli TaxID=28095 RepID=UPI001FC9A28C|nr:StbB family protein [Burkholderia gladioli]
MSIAILNCSGNVGKTTVARELFAPRLQGMTVRQIESINADESNGSEVQMMLAGQFDELHRELLTGTPLIVDIGASNVEEYLERLRRSSGAHEDYSLFVVPVVPEGKQTRDTFKTIDMLVDLGVAADRIRILFNKVELKSREPHGVTVQREFPEVFAQLADDPEFWIDIDAVVPLSKTMSEVARRGLTLFQLHHVLQMDDLKQTLREAKTDDEKNEAANLISLKRYASTLTPQLDRAFDAITRGVDL